MQICHGQPPRAPEQGRERAKEEWSAREDFKKYLLHYLGGVGIKMCEKSKHSQWYKEAKTENCKSSCEKKYFFIWPLIPVLSRNRCRHFQLAKEIVSCHIFHSLRWLLIYHLSDGTNRHSGEENRNKTVSSDLVELTRLRHQGLFPKCARV